MTILVNNSPALIPLLLLVSAVLIPLIAYKKDSLAFVVTISATTLTTFIAFYNIFRVINHGPVHYHFGGWIPPIGIEYVLDHLSGFITLVINVIALLVLIHSKIAVKEELASEKRVPYYAAVLLMLCGFNGIVLTGDLFNLYVFLEISSLAMYGLIAAGEKKSPVAAFRYLILGAIGASFYLLGIGFLYLATGSLNMADVRNIIPHILNEPTLIVAASLIVTGFGIKMAIFPLHGWLPDAYTYAPSTSSALIAPTGTKIGAYVILRVLFFVFGINYVTKTIPLTTILAFLSAIGIIYGSILAMAQKEMKRMLAYSSIAQIGYIGLGIGLANPLGLIGAVLHVMNHAFMKACLFLVSTNYRTKLGHSDISQLDNSVRKKMPWSTAAFTVAALSMVGLPPTVGFFSKWYLALGTIENSSWIYLAVILVSSLLNAVYFFRIIEKVYMKPIKTIDKEEKNLQYDEVAFSMLFPTLILALGVLVLGFLNTIIVKTIILKIIPPGM